MWRRLSTQLRTLAPSRSVPRHAAAAAATTSPSPPPLTLRPAAAFLSRHFSTGSENVVTKKRVEDVMPIATGHEREELEAELEGRNILEIDHPEGPFGTKEAPAVIKSYYDRRIVGCPGVEGEDEHDVVWFWLKKGEPHECPVCSQYFVLEVVGPGGSPDGHDSDDEGHHH